MTLRDHLRPEQHRSLALAEAAQRVGRVLGTRGAISVEADQLELGKGALELELEALGAGTETGELHRAAGGAARRRGHRETAVVAGKPPVLVEHERDVAALAADRRATGAAVHCGRDAPAIEQEYCLRPALGDAPQLLEQRRRERVSGLPAQVDDLDRWQLAADPSAELQPLERRPALGPRRRGAENRDRPFERGALDGDRARVVARIGVLLVGGVVLLVDDDHTEPGERREDRRTSAHDDARLTRNDPRTLVAPPLGLGQTRMDDRNPVTEARAHPPQRLGCQRDLRNEQDRAEAALERRSGDLEIHLGLPRAGGAVEQKGAALPASSAETIRSLAACCSGRSCAGSSSPPIEWRSPGAGRSRRRRGNEGATSASARAGVDP